MPNLSLARVISNRKVAADCYQMIISAPAMAAEVQPGQFFHLRCSEQLDPLLRRPISLFSVDRAKGEIGLLYRVVGRGTALLAKREPGSELDIMGPLGRGFRLPTQAGTVVLVGGGIGVAPLYATAVAAKATGCKVITLIGAGTAAKIYALAEFKEVSDRVLVATDDGSAGIKGRVTELLGQVLATEQIAAVLCCGPNPMLQAAGQIAMAAGVPCQVSLEEYMGCGVGACLACACKTKQAPSSPFTYKKVCVDGPVFNAEEVIWDGQA